MEDRAYHGSRLIQDQRHSNGMGTFFMNAVTVFASLLTITPFVAGMITPPQTAVAALPVMPTAVAPAASLMIVPPVETHVTAWPCTLEKETFTAEVSGCVARVCVQQHFHNPNRSPIDANYTFPLSDTAAVDEMNMQIGERKIKGSIKRLKEARQIYQQARAYGYNAALLEQKRTNVFEQSVANVQGGKDIDITVKYTEMLPYAHGKFNLVFPTAVGPRFTPAKYHGDVVSTSGIVPGTITADANIDAGGLPIVQVESAGISSTSQIDGSHAVFHSNRVTAGSDLVLDWQVAGSELQTGYVAHKSGDAGFVSAVVVPPAKMSPNGFAPRELVFIVDCSGSQQGAPLNKAKETMHYILDRMSPEDTFQIIAFNSRIWKFAPEPRVPSDAMKSEAHRFIDSLSAENGTIMGPAIEAACATVAPKNRLRIVTIMTDGYLNNDYEILSMVKRLRGTSRWFAFGTGQSVNRTLIDGIAREGGGEPDYLAVSASGDEVAQEFYSRIQAPVLTDVKVKAEGVELSDIYPRAISDVWEQRPLYFQARYHHGGNGTLVVTGHRQGRPYTQRIPIHLPERQSANAAIQQIWARTRIEDLMSQDWAAMQDLTAQTARDQEITRISLKYHVLSQFTAFVAVDSAFDPDKKTENLDKREVAKKLPSLDPSYQRYSPQTVMLGAGAVGIAGLARTELMPALAVMAGAGVLSATVFGFAKGALQQTLSQSFSTVVSQLNAVNSYSAAGYGGNGSPAAYSSSSGIQTFASPTPSATLSPVPVIASVPVLPTAPVPAPVRALPAASSLQSVPVSSATQFTSNYRASTLTQTNNTVRMSQSSALQGATNGTIGPQGGDAVIGTALNSAAIARAANPFSLHLNLPFIGSVNLDVNLLAIALQWLWFILAVVMVSPALTLKPMTGRLHRLSMGAAFFFISANIPHTMEWLMQCARNANLV
jgi:Ca-activated chloride channel family protein